MKKAIVCHICDFSPEYGGTFIDALVALGKFSRERMRLEMFCIFPDAARGREWLNALEGNGIGYGFVPRKRNVVSNMRSLLLNYNPRILHSHFSRYDLSALFLKSLMYKEAKVVWHYHNPTDKSFRQRIKDFLKIKLLFNFLGDACIAVAEGVYSSIRDAQVSPEKNVLIHNAINTERFITDKDPVEDMRVTLQIPRNNFVFLLLGWDPIRKGVDVYVKAAAQMSHANNTNCTFMVIGRKEARAFVADLLDKSDLHRLDIRVIEPVGDLSSLLKTIDVFVSASRIEGMSYAVLEAMAAQRLIISSDIGGVRQTYGKADGVWLFSADDDRELVSMMERAVAMPSSDKQTLGNANAQYVLSNHSLMIWTEKIGKLYETLLKQ